MAKSNGLPSSVGNAVNISNPGKPCKTVNPENATKIGGPNSCPKLTSVKCPQRSPISKGKGGK